MTSPHKNQRPDLERRINDAADGYLGPQEIAALEKELQSFPDLHQEYLAIMELPDLSTAYGQNPDGPSNDSHMRHTKKLVKDEFIKSGSVEMMTITWFKRYALAASLLIFVFSSLANHFIPQIITGQDEMTLPEFLYPNEDNNAEAYVTFLDDLIEQ